MPKHRKLPAMDFPSFQQALDCYSMAALPMHPQIRELFDFYQLGRRTSVENLIETATYHRKEILPVLFKHLPFKPSHQPPVGADLPLTQRWLSRHWERHLTTALLEMSEVDYAAYENLVYHTLLPEADECELRVTSAAWLKTKLLAEQRYQKRQTMSKLNTEALVTSDDTVKTYIVDSAGVITAAASSSTSTSSSAEATSSGKAKKTKKTKKRKASSSDNSVEPKRKRTAKEVELQQTICRLEAQLKQSRKPADNGKKAELPVIKFRPRLTARLQAANLMQRFPRLISYPVEVNVNFGPACNGWNSSGSFSMQARIIKCHFAAHNMMIQFLPSAITRIPDLVSFWLPEGKRASDNPDFDLVRREFGLVENYKASGLQLHCTTIDGQTQWRSRTIIRIPDVAEPYVLDIRLSADRFHQASIRVSEIADSIPSFNNAVLSVLYGYCE